MNEHTPTTWGRFAVGENRFAFRGVTYGAFAPRIDGARYPERDNVKQPEYVAPGLIADEPGTVTVYRLGEQV